jgi:hypothetical protein
MSHPWLLRPGGAAAPSPLMALARPLVYEAQPDGRVVANMTIRDIVDAKRKRKAGE